jgi:tRNA-modifying protein YgfZ
MNLLPHLAAISVTGMDAQRFLQSQLSSNLADLAPISDLGPLTQQTATQFSSWCAANGRVIGLGWLYRAGPNFYWVVHKADTSALLLGLKRYLLRSKASLQLDARGVFSGLGADGITLPDGRALHLAELETAESALADSEPLQAALAAWLRADIVQGMAVCGGGERFLPQMLGLERYAGLSLKKGCFPGQEVIARTHYKGEVKRALRTLQADIAPGLGLVPGTHGVCESTERIDVLQVMDDMVLAVVPKALPSAFAIILATGTVCQLQG